MNINWTALRSLGLERSQQRGGLSTPPPAGDAGQHAGANATSRQAEELPEDFFALNDAAIRGDLDLVKSIFEKERLPNTPMERLENKKFAPIMHRALLQGRVHVVAYFLSQEIPFKMIQIEIAIEDGLHSLLSIFLDHGWNINGPIRNDKPPPLIMALDNRQLCEWFLSHGADPNAQCRFDETPLSVAVMRAPRDIIELLFQHGGSIEKGQLLHCAVHRHKPDHLDIIRMLLDKGCNINAIRYENHSESYGYYNLLFGLGTPLYEAAEYNRLAVVELLLANGANPLIRNTWDQLPIDRARSKGHTNIVELLRPYSESTA